jgi:hypothetical protein
MRKPPPLMFEEIQKIYAQRWVALLLETMGFINEKLGMQAVGEFQNRLASHTAPALKETQIPKVQDGALKFALLCGILDKNLYGSEIEIPVDGDDKAVLEIKKCALLIPIEEFKKKGLPVTREIFCFACQSYLSLLADKLELNLEGELKEKGCSLSINSRKKFEKTIEEEGI